nr:DnaB-like helicase N-terminal domain-containing protein [uncultured Roseococcus sp.]
MNVLAAPMNGASAISPPADLQGEQLLLGHLIANRGTGITALGFLGAQHFGDPVHGRIHSTIERFAAKGLTISLASLRLHFERTGELSEVGGPVYLAQLYTARDEKGRSAADCARSIHDRWIERMLLGARDDA